MNNTVKQSAQTAQDIARNIARQVAHEPLEILKDAGGQITGRPEGQATAQPGIQTARQPEGQTASQQNQKVLQDKAFASRRMQALQSEINDIRKQDLFGDLQRKISEGIDVPLEDYMELSMEQKQVLKAQKEAFQIQMLNAKNANDNSVGVPSIHSKPSRRFGAGQKQEAEKQQTRVEKPVPPSG
jgi:hypothetical protein